MRQVVVVAVVTWMTAAERWRLAQYLEQRRSDKRESYRHGQRATWAKTRPGVEEPERRGFVWGTATAAYQVEGFRSEDGRQPSVWDAFDTPNTSSVVVSVTPSGSSRTYRGENAERADEDYELFDETVGLALSLGFGAARLSISWPRVATYDDDGKTFVANEAGIDHYLDVLEAYQLAGIKVALTMWHWDLPLALEERAARDGCESAWLCDFLPVEFGKYAELLISRFSGLVHWWITLNEPLTIIQNGYSGSGPHAPGRCADRTACYAGDDTVEPYKAAKTLILAHGRAFRAWQKAGAPGAGCGVTLNGDYCIPFTESDVQAATRCLEWQVPLFFDPIFYGRWPESVDAVVRGRFDGWAWTSSELALVNGAHDGTHMFINTYTSRFAKEVDACDACFDVDSFSCDSNATVSGYNFTDGQPVGTPSSNGWLFNYGAGIRKLLQWYDARYPGRTFIITENGWGNATQDSLQVELTDTERCNFYRDYVSNVSAAAVFDRVDVAAYFAWSLIDNYEWADGFSVRFGLVYVNYTDMSRTPKHSALYWKYFINNATSLNDTIYLPPCENLFVF